MREKTILSEIHSRLAAEWHPTKNGNLTPEQFTAGSNKKVWWLGKCGHEWQAAIYSRANQNSGCPYCSGRFAIPGKTDLATTHPALAAEWHPTKNGELTPEQFTVCSGKKIWWQCSLGHEWQAIIVNRTKRKSTCPYCAGYKMTSLSNYNPLVAAEWNIEKNGELTPEQVTPYSAKKIWWRCDRNHEWQSAVKSRTLGCGCPYCSGRLAIPEETDLNTTHPELATEWHPTKNGELTPKHVTAGSGKKVWWLCPKCGHEWQAAPNSRTNMKSGCPACANKKVLPGYNDLLTINPELAAEWHPTKNGELTPEQVTAGSNKKVWWLGKCGHEWQSAIWVRNKGFGCATCARLKNRKTGKQL